MNLSLSLSVYLSIYCLGQDDQNEVKLLWSCNTTANENEVQHNYFGHVTLLVSASCNADGIFNGIIASLGQDN